MALTCGWPYGPHKEDGWCGEPVTVVFLVRVLDVPVTDPGADTHPSALPLCPRHTPHEET